MDHKDDFKNRLLFYFIIAFCSFSFAVYMMQPSANTQNANIVQPVAENKSFKLVPVLTEKIDFENEPTASTEKFSSGTKSYKLTSKIEYGVGVYKAIKDIPSFESVKEIDVQFKCFQKNKIDGICVLSLEDENGKNILWDGKNIECTKNNEWCDVHCVYQLNLESLKPNTLLKIYPWNKSKQEFYVDDFLISYNGIEKKTEAKTTSLGLNYFFDFEDNEGLTGTETIKQTSAHSGKMAVDMSGGKEYSPMFSKNKIEICSEVLNKISASVWIYPLQENPNAVLTATITNSKGASVSWNGKGTENQPFPKNQWTKLSASFNLPGDKINNEDKISVNVWNKGRTDLIIDDLGIVYGETPERTGNPSPIDENKIYSKTFIPEKNKPPFKSVLFTKQEINNDNSVYVTHLKNNSTADFSPNDNFLVGDFIIDKNNLDEIICIKNNLIGLYSYSPETKMFGMIWEKTGRADSILDIEFPSVQVKSYLQTNAQLNFSGNYFGDAKIQTLLLNNNWKFDLKLIENGDVVGTVDFKGYPSDWNPKYYEFVKIIPGHFITSKQTSILIMMRNCADKDFNGKKCNSFETISYLPNSTQLYSFEK